GFGAGLVVLGVLVHFGLWWLFMYFERRDENAKQSQYPLTAEQRQHFKETGERTLPPSPRLEGLPQSGPSPTVGRWQPGTAEEQAEKQKAWLNSYGAEKQGDRVVYHIPIEQAMKALVGKLPARPQDEAGSGRDTDTQPPSDSSSGRVPQ